MRSFRFLLSVLVFASLFMGACSSNSTDGQTSGQLMSIQNKGSDTMVNLALAWAEAYQAVRPDVLISVTGGGSGTGITALANNTVDIANASRAIKDEEISCHAGEWDRSD